MGIREGLSCRCQEWLAHSVGEIRSIIIKVQHNCVRDRRSYGKLEDPPIARILHRVQEASAGGSGTARP